MIIVPHLFSHAIFATEILIDAHSVLITLFHAQVAANHSPLEQEAC